MGAEVKSMEIKKPQQTTTERAVSAKRAQTFVADVKSEIFKITWTSREELIAYTKIVVLATLLFGLAIYALDLMIQGALSGLSVVMRLMGG